MAALTAPGDDIHAEGGEHRGRKRGRGAISPAMCINAWTRVRHWSAPERVPVVETSEGDGMDASKEWHDPFSTGSVNDDQLDLFFSSDLKVRLSGGGFARTGTVTRPTAVPAFTWAREAEDRRRRLSVDATAVPCSDDAWEPRPNDAAVAVDADEGGNVRLPTTATTEGRTAPSQIPREASSTYAAWAVALLTPNCNPGNDLAKMERMLPADKARPCPEWKRRKKKKNKEATEEAEHLSDASVLVENVNVLRDQSPLVPEVEVSSPPMLESPSCPVPLSNCNAVSEKSSYVKRRRPPRSGTCRHTCGAAFGRWNAEVNWVNLLTLLTLCCTLLVSPCVAKICNSVQLKENMSEWQTLLEGCSVIEGSLVITTGELGCISFGEFRNLISVAHRNASSNLGGQ